MAASWSTDSSKIATAGADGIVTIWDASTQKAAQAYTIGSDVSSQQNGIVYANPNTVVSISLSGTLNLFDTRESDNTKWRKLHGPTKAITASTYSIASDKTFYAGSFDGTVKAFDFSGKEDGLCSEVEGTGHSALVSAFADGGNGKVWSAGWDDKVAAIEGANFACVIIRIRLIAVTLPSQRKLNLRALPLPPMLSILLLPLDSKSTLYQAAHPPFSPEKPQPSPRLPVRPISSRMETGRK